MKLGLVIKITSNGEHESLAINKGKWAENIPSIGSDTFSYLSGYDKKYQSVLLMKFLGDDGYLIGVILKDIGSGRLGDNTTAWIHIPAEANISGSDMEKLVKTVEKEIKNPIKTDEKSLNAAFDVERSSKNCISAVSQIHSDDNGGYGYCYYGIGTDYTLGELLCDFIAQREYSRFKGVFFIDKTLGISFKGGEEIKEFKKICTIQPPKCDENGFTPYLNGKQFTQPMEVADGESLTIVWRKEGYREISKPFRAMNGQSSMGVEIRQGDIFRRISREDIIVEDKKGARLNDAIVKIDDRLFREQEYVPESELENGKIKISVLCDGYKKQEVVLKPGTTNVSMVLNSYDRIYHLDPKYGKGLTHHADITIKTYGEDRGMPLKGYVDNYEYLKYNDDKIIRWITIIGALIVGILLGWCVYSFSYSYELGGSFPFVHKKEVQSPSKNTRSAPLHGTSPEQGGGLQPASNESNDSINEDTPNSTHDYNKGSQEGSKNNRPPESQDSRDENSKEPKSR